MNEVKNEVLANCEVKTSTVRSVPLFDDNEIEKIEIQIDLNSNTAQVDLSKFIGNDKPQIKWVKRKFDHLLEKELEKIKKEGVKIMNHSKVSETKKVLTSQIMSQLLSFYSFEDIFISSAFSGNYKMDKDEMVHTNQ